MIYVNYIHATIDFIYCLSILKEPSFPSPPFYYYDLCMHSCYQVLYLLFYFTFFSFQCVIANVGELTFQEAFDRTGRIINITVAPVNNYDPPRLLNYLTAPHVCVWSAAAASCAVPGAFGARVPLTVYVFYMHPIFFVCCLLIIFSSFFRDKKK